MAKNIPLRLIRNCPFYADLRIYPPIGARETLIAVPEKIGTLKIKLIRYATACHPVKSGEIFSDDVRGGGLVRRNNGAMAGAGSQHSTQDALTMAVYADEYAAS